jgi:SAM-dependent methyltransferase
MKILVAIASHGTRNDAYLQRLVETYRQMPHDVHIVVLSNIHKPVAPGVELVVGAPSLDPWSLPFAHKPIFARRLEDFDLFIYSEDDTLVTLHNVDAFLWATSVLRPDELAGFMRSEEGPDGALHCSTIHNHYHWDAASACRRGGETFAHFTNEHGACYLLTREQLRRAIASGGFCVPPHQGRYDLLVTAATDPYTQCGFTKLVCVSRMPEFTCRHLSNRYVGRTGIPASLVTLQVRALIEIAAAGKPPPAPIRAAPRLAGTRWIKSYYEPCRDDLVELVPDAARSVLSVGCGWGSTEEALRRRHLDVAAIPMDAVIGRVAASRGVRIVDADLASAPSRLAGESFDVLLITGLLHLLDDPVAVLRSYRPLLIEGGVLIATVPNLGHAAVWWRRLRRAPEVDGLDDPARSGVHVASLAVVRRWLRNAGFEPRKSRHRIAGRWRRYHLGSLGLLPGLWASEFTVVARAVEASARLVSGAAGPAPAAVQGAEMLAIPSLRSLESAP